MKKRFFMVLCRGFWARERNIEEGKHDYYTAAVFGVGVETLNGFVEEGFEKGF